MTEYISSIGSSESLDNKKYWNLVIEGYAMAYAVSKVLKEANFQVILTLGKLFRNISIPFDIVYIDNREKYFDVLEEKSRNVDLVLPIAPPRELVEICQSVHSEILGPEKHIIKSFSNKKETILKLSNAGFKTPKTFTIPAKSTKRPLLKYPFIIKPTDMAGCTGLSLVMSENCFFEAVKYAFQHTFSNEVIAQEYIVGIPASISMISDGEEILLLQNNLQLIKLYEKKRFKYIGGITPLRSKELYEKSLGLVRNLIKKFNGIRGFIGLDVVWKNWEPYIVEINPRLTTSFLGLMELYNKGDLGALLISSVFSQNSKYKKPALACRKYFYYVILERAHVRNREVVAEYALPYSSRRIIVGSSSSLGSALLQTHKLTD